jgi:hypothetical protein
VAASTITAAATVSFIRPPAATDPGLGCAPGAGRWA